MKGKGVKKLILISNDDGIEAKGLRQLIEVGREYGEVLVVAPNEQMSGMSHAITIKTPLRARLVRKEKGLKIYSCQGTPVDCIKLALNQLTGNKPDLVLSGINHGSNSAASVVYSGTMAAAMEGCINLIPSAGFSLLDYNADADFEAAGRITSKIIWNIINYGLPEGVCLNVNIPAGKFNELKGLKICRQTRGYWKEEFVKRTDPYKGEYYWLTGSYFNQEVEAQDTDEFALARNYVSIVPIRVDFTSQRGMTYLRSWDLNTIWEKQE